MVFSCLNYKYKYSFLIINFIHVFLTNKSNLFSGL